jgi:hypothetical protein
MTKVARVRFQTVPANQNAASAGLVGSGQLDVTAEGLHIKGKRGATTVPTIIAVVVALAAAIGVIILCLAVGLDRGRNAYKGIAGLTILGAGIAGFVTYRLLQLALPGDPVNALVPWPSLRIQRATRKRHELYADTVGGNFIVAPSDAESEAILAEAFNVAQTL